MNNETLDFPVIEAPGEQAQATLKATALASFVPIEALTRAYSEHESTLDQEGAE